MTIIEIRGDNSPRGILKHWSRKRKDECAHEILRCWTRIEALESENAALRAELAARGLVLSEEEIAAVDYMAQRPFISSVATSHVAVLRNLLERAKR